ncbi:hypothetical protein BJ875DRAFT_473761 [Amylocarpus encephaloides]|uniref:Uncharacterized protein n=1 Tax=Amylocarpus encephaloides TaxID=45428 RepID=A0A9P7Y9L2_9HELO|nr:hypothetical protein BJ875DRAFT_473761 [Amylocarpus encephaloides]
MLAFTEAGDAVDAVAAAEGSGLLPGFGTPKQGSENDMPEEDEGLENESSEDESSDDEIYDEIYDDNSSNHSHDSDPFVNRQVIPSSRSNDGDVQDDEELPSTLHVENIAALPRLATPSAEAPMQNLPRGDSNYTSGTVIHRHAEVAAAMMGVDGPYCSHNSGVHIDRSSSSEESPTEAFLRRRKVRRGRHENQLPGLDRGA